MDNGKPVPIGVWVLLVLVTSPIWIMGVLIAMLTSPAFSALLAATVASAFIFGVVRRVNHRDTTRPVKYPAETPDDTP
jgi:hypothetical protein